MKIGFEAKRAVENNTGLGNYSRYVIEALATYYPDNEYLLFAPKQITNTRLEKIYRQPNIKFIFPQGIAKIFSALWRHCGLAKPVAQSRVDIFHGLCNQITVGLNVKSVVTIHDLIFLRYPQFYKPIDRLIYKWKFGYACRNADKIIAISESTKRDLQKFFQVPAKKIEVIYQGCHPAFAEEVSTTKKTAVLEKYQLPASFVLYVGSIEERKNLLLVVRALQYLPQKIHLVAVGKKTNYQRIVEEQAKKFNLTERLHLLNNINFEDLPALYQLAKIFVYPSFFEGFGIPIIEALSAGTPVVAAVGSCLEEAGGPNSIYIDPQSEAELANVLNDLLNNPTKCQQMIEAGKEYAKRFDAHKMANNLISLYNSLLTTNPL
ncbi:MAG: glycosyltransferase family 4 protein [Deltaproteobacteria bacterium]|nr:glycosyltransferase family 4 protein [Deltaproteobacteria bacterium]